MKEKNLTDITIARCPFCGGRPVIETKMLNHAFVIRCKNEKCGMQPSTKMYRSLLEAIEVWRERP